MMVGRFFWGGNFDYEEESTEFINNHISQGLELDSWSLRNSMIANYTIFKLLTIYVVPSLTLGFVCFYSGTIYLFKRPASSNGSFSDDAVDSLEGTGDGSFDSAF